VNNFYLFPSLSKGFYRMLNIKTVLGVVMIAGFLTGCGHKTEDRAISGAGIGAGVGAAGAAITGGNPLTGAVIGGVVGGAGGAVTKSRDVNLGKPIWK
jgi:osmotically inducible lipoprotein OsmB